MSELPTYTEKDIKTLSRMYAEYWPVAEIAKKLGKTERAITTKIHRLGLPQRDSIIIRLINFHGREILKWGSDRESILMALEAKGAAAKQATIALRNQRQVAALDYLLYEVAQGHDRNMAIRRARARGATMPQIGRAVGISKQAVAVILRG
jgi:hypothetical protein